MTNKPPPSECIEVDYSDMPKGNAFKKPPREFWLLEEEIKFGIETSSNPKDHACTTVLFRIPICIDRPEKSIHVIEKSAFDTLQAELDEARKVNLDPSLYLKRQIDAYEKMKQKLERAESLLRELESKIVFNSENQSKIDRYFAEDESK